MENHHVSWENSISMVIFHSKLLVYQRVLWPISLESKRAHFSKGSQLLNNCIHPGSLRITPNLRSWRWIWRLKNLWIFQAQQQCHAQWACVILLVDYPTFLGPRSKHARQKSLLGLCLQIFTGVFRLHLQCQHQIDTLLIIIQVWGCARVRPASSFWCCLYQVLYPTPTLTMNCLWSGRRETHRKSLHSIAKTFQTMVSSLAILLNKPCFNSRPEENRLCDIGAQGVATWLLACLKSRVIWKHVCSGLGLWYCFFFFFFGGFSWKLQVLRFASSIQMANHMKFLMQVCCAEWAESWQTFRPTCIPWSRPFCLITLHRALPLHQKGLPSK